MMNVFRGLTQNGSYFSQSFDDEVNLYAIKAARIVKEKKIGYSNTTCLHYYHGSQKNRRYFTRDAPLFDIKYDPSLHIYKNQDGLYQLKQEFQKTVIEIQNYFDGRKEDENYMMKDGTVLNKKVES